MKKIFLFLAIASSSLYTSFSQESKNTLSLSSKGEVCVVPNIATINLNIETKQKNIKEAKTIILTESNNLNKLLFRKGIKKQNIQTTNLDLRKEFRWQGNKRVFDGYRASISTQIRITELKKLSEIYTELLDNEYIRINGLNYSHDDLNSLENKAYVAALKNANNLAKQLTETSGYTNQKIIAISNLGNTIQTPRPSLYKAKSMAMVDEASHNEIPAEVNPGQIKITKKLHVIYEMN